jgi:hypothetical protein
MKIVKTIIIFLLVSILCSCSTSDDTNTCIPEVVETSTYIEVKPLIYKGHTFLWFRSKVGKGFGGVVHDPECKKCNK